MNVDSTRTAWFFDKSHCCSGSLLRRLSRKDENLAQNAAHLGEVLRNGFKMKLQRNSSIPYSESEKDH
jgi:hypothetical protein